jgi:hypothetical protein
MITCTANEHMKYGTLHEKRAWATYQALAPHQRLQELGFSRWQCDNAHGWLGGSPDGLITLLPREDNTSSIISAAAGTAAAAAAAVGTPQVLLPSCDSAVVGSAAGGLSQLDDWLQQHIGACVRGGLALVAPTAQQTSLLCWHVQGNCFCCARKLLLLRKETASAAQGNCFCCARKLLLLRKETATTTTLPRWFAWPGRAGDQVPVKCPSARWPSAAAAVLLCPSGDDTAADHTDTIAVLPV